MGLGRARVVVIGVFALGGCRERNPAFMPDAVLTTSDGGTSSGAVTESSSSSSATTMPMSTTTLGTTGGDDSTTTTDAESSSGGGTIPYASCNDDQCPRGWDNCIALDDPASSWCSHDCDVPEDCELPSTGDAEVVCAGPSGHDCALDCSDGQSCPDGMSCVELFASVVRCVWEA